MLGQAFVGRFFARGLNQHQYEVIDELVTWDFVVHSALLGKVNGGDAFKRSVLGLLSPCQTCTRLWRV